MLQILGCTMVVVGCSYWGWYQGMELKGRLRLTEEFIRVLSYIKREIKEKHRPLPKIIGDLGRKQGNCVSEYFQILSKKISADRQATFSVGWAESMLAELPEDLMVILEPLGYVLGQYDGKTQGEALDSVLLELKDLRRIQEEKCEKMVQVYGAFGITSGLFLVILLL